MDDLISRQAAIDALDKHCDNVCQYSKKQRSVMCGACPLGTAFDVIEELPSAQTEQRWIPVSERLPEYGIQVLTTDKDGDFELNHIIDEDDEEWFFDGAIAWCELPEPWKGDSDG